MPREHVEGPKDAVLVESVPHVRGSLYPLDSTRVIGHDSIVPFNPI